MNVIRLFSPLLGLALLLSGCGGGDKSQPSSEGAPSAAPGPKWPTGPIKIVCMDTDEGDIAAFLQALAPALGAELGVEVSIESAGAAAIGQVAAAEADGHTWLGMSDEMLVASRNGLTNVHLADWEYTVVARSPAVISVPPNTRTPKLQQLIREAKHEDSEITFSASRPGGIWHAKLDVLARASKAQLPIKTYPEPGPSLLAATSGQVNAVVTSVEDQLAAIKGGKLLALAIIDAKPVSIPGIGEIPSAADLYLGVEDDPVNRFVGVAVPAGAPEAVVTRLGQAIGKALNDNSVTALANKRFWHLDGTTGEMAKKQITEAARHREALFASMEKKAEKEF